MDDLYSFFLQGRNTRPIHKWHHYFEVYERYLEPFRLRQPTLLEIGVENGGSLEMWRRYFGPRCRLYGLDIDPTARRHEDVATRMYIGDQKDRALLRQVVREAGPFDIVIDDGGHTAEQTIVTFEELYPHLTEQGVYIVEDTHTALWGGAFMDRPDGQSFLHYAFARCVELMQWTGRRENFPVLGTDQNGGLAASAGAFCRSTKAVNFFDSMVVFERARRPVPRHERRSAAPVAVPVPIDQGTGKAPPAPASQVMTLPGFIAAAPAGLGAGAAEPPAQSGKQGGGAFDPFPS